MTLWTWQTDGSDFDLFGGWSAYLKNKGLRLNSHIVILWVNVYASESYGQFTLKAPVPTKITVVKHCWVWSIRRWVNTSKSGSYLPALSVGIRIHWHCSLQRNKTLLLGMTLNCMWQWGSTSGDLGSVENTLSFSLFSSPLWAGVVVPIRITCMGQIDMLKHYSSSIGPCAKNKQTNKTNRPQTSLKKQLRKNVNMNLQWMQFPNL